ncbi:MAG: CHAT domain-containing protein [Cyanobacteria bacterium P01_E01_bin.6]
MINRKKSQHRIKIFVSSTAVFNILLFSLALLFSLFSSSVFASSAIDGNKQSHRTDSDYLLISQNVNDASEPTTPVGYLIRGRSYRDQGLFSKAEADFRQAIELALSDEFEAIALHNLGLALEDLGRVNQAIAKYQEAIRTDPTYPDTYQTLINLLIERGDPEAEIYQARLQELIDMMSCIGNDSQSDDFLELIKNGNTLRESEQHAEAIQCYELAIAINPNLPSAHNNRGLSLEELGNYEEALLAYSRAANSVPFERARLNLSESDALSTAYSNVGRLSLQLGQFEDAEWAYDLALVSDPTLIQYDLNTAQTGSTLTATDHFKMGNLLGTQARAFERAEALSFSERRWQRALASYEEAIRLDTSFAPAYNNIGRYWLEHGESDKGMRFLQQAVELSPTPSRLENLASAWLALAFETQNTDETLAQEYFHNAVNAYLKLEQVIDRVEQIPGDIQNSSLLDTLIIRRNFTNFDESLSGSASTTNQDYYSRYIERLMWLYRSPDQTKGLTEGMDFDTPLDVQAFQVSERARVQGLLNIISEEDICQTGETEASGAGIEPLWDELCQLRSEFSTLVDQWQNIESTEEVSIDSDAVQNSIAAQLITVSSDFETVKSLLIEQGINSFQLQTDEITLDEVQANLDNNTILLEYWLGNNWLGNEKSYLWAISKPGVLSPSGFMSYKIDADRRTINALAQEYYDYLTNPSKRFKPVSTARSGMELSQLLLAPVAEHLDNNQLVVVADGMLRYIPFNALPDPNANQEFMTGDIAGIDLDDLPEPLIHNHEIIHLPSFSTLLKVRRRSENREAGSKTLAIFTDPALSNTRQEAHRLLEIAKNEDRDFGETSAIFEASQVSIASENLADYRLIHFATHGRVINTDLASSGLIASSTDRQSRLVLSVPQVFSLNIPADLVVLSACRTGLGEEVTGAGIINLSQGFLAAGASGVVISLWSVNDESTLVLMEEFYDELLDNFDTGRNTPQTASALREAQLELWDKSRWNLPYYWAGFIFQGDWR